MLAVSKNVTPSSSAFCTTAALCSLSHRIPKLLHPSPTAETWSPERPRFLYSTVLHPHREVHSVPAHLGHDPFAGRVVRHDEREPHAADGESAGVEGVLDRRRVATGGKQHRHQG